jgi:hypothetical protein
MNEEKPAKSGKSAEVRPAPGRESTRPNPAHVNVDRLIELASDDKSVDILSPEAKDSKGNTMWKILLQLKPLLPYLTRLVPLLDIVVPVQNAALSNEVRQDMTKIQTLQREVSITVQDQSLQLKRIEEELIRLREASQRHTLVQADLAEDLESVAKVARLVGIGLAILLGALIVMTGVLLNRIAH